MCQHRAKGLSNFEKLESTQSGAITIPVFFFFFNPCFNDVETKVQGDLGRLLSCDLNPDLCDPTVEPLVTMPWELPGQYLFAGTLLIGVLGHLWYNGN